MDQTITVPERLDAKAQSDLIQKIKLKLLEAAFDVNAFMDLIVDEMLVLTPATGVVVELVDGDEMVYRSATGTIKDYIGLKLSKANSISGLCVTTQEVLICEDTEKDQRVNLEACRRIQARSMVVAPLISVGTPIGVLKIISNKPMAFNEEDVKTLQLMSGFLANALANQLRQEAKDFF
jgi:putative methionine-R-sulfoxide reductase with GAF domain